MISGYPHFRKPPDSAYLCRCTLWHNYAKSPFLGVKLTISMAISNSYVKLPRGKWFLKHVEILNLEVCIQLHPEWEFLRWARSRWSSCNQLLLSLGQWRTKPPKKYLPTWSYREVRYFTIKNVHVMRFQRNKLAKLGMEPFFRKCSTIRIMFGKWRLPWMFVMQHICG